MEPLHNIGLIVIGGSWGGFKASQFILNGLPADFKIPVLLVLHRLRNFESDLAAVYNNKLTLKVREVEEKEKISAGNIYLVPSNYHVLIERDQTFSLDVSEYENYSRPSIDVTFTSAAEIYGAKTIGILLSGASKDGSSGLRSIKDKGGLTIVQDPKEAEVDTMPFAGINLVPDSTIMTLKGIRDFLYSLI